MAGVFRGPHHFLDFFLLLIKWKIVREPRFRIVEFQRYFEQLKPAIRRDAGERSACCGRFGTRHNTVTYWRRKQSSQRTGRSNNNGKSIRSNTLRFRER